MYASLPSFDVCLYCLLPNYWNEPTLVLYLFSLSKFGYSIYAFAS
jgi:hypothetical protein